MNLPRLRTLMHDARLDALLVTSPPNVAYLTGYRCWCESQLRAWMVHPGGDDERVLRSAAIVTADGKATLVAGVGFSLNALAVDDGVDFCLFGTAPFDEAGPWPPLSEALRPVHDAQLGACSDFPAAVVMALRRVGAATGRVGIDESVRSTGLWSGLRETLPTAELRDCRQLLRLTRAVKTVREVSLLARSAELNESALLAALSAQRDGERTGALSTRYRMAVASAGADFDHFTPAICGLGFTEAGSFDLHQSDVLAVDSGCIVGGYFSDTQLTTSKLPLPDHLAARYDALRASVIEVGAAALRPGARASEAYEEMTIALRESGAGGVAGGHGLGLELRDLPVLAPARDNPIRDDCIEVDSDLTLEPGMVVNVEATVFIPGVASLGCEISCLVTAHGPEPLVGQDRGNVLVTGSS